MDEKAKARLQRLVRWLKTHKREAMKDDGKVFCWGSNASGSAGVIVPTSGAPWRLAGVP